MKLLRSLLTFGGVCMSFSTSAEELTVGDKFRVVEPRSFVTAFLGHCVQNPGRLDKVGAAATALGYAETPEPFWTMLGPQEVDAHYHSWFVVEGDGAPYFLGISEGQFDSETYQICAVSNPFMEAENAIAVLKEFMELPEANSDETIAGSRTRLWLTPRILDGAYVSANDIGEMGSDGVTLAIGAPKQY